MDMKNDLRAKHEAFISGDDEAMKKAKYDVRRAVKLAKNDYKVKLENDLSTKDSRDLWQGLNQITGYKPKSKSAPKDDHNLTNELNTFYARFDRGPPPTLPPSCDTPVNLVITPHDTKHAMSKLKVRKASGPDNISLSY